MLWDGWGQCVHSVVGGPQWIVGGIERVSVVLDCRWDG